MSGARIAFVTCAKWPAIADDDAVAAAVLGELDATVVAAVWSDPNVVWSDFDAVVLRSTWDYFERLPEFLDWLNRMEAAEVRVWNPVPTVRWNLDKRYLLELAARDIAIIPTERLERGQRTSLEEVLRRRGWTRAVVKPAVSAGSFRTFRTSIAEAASAPGTAHHEDAFQRLLAECDVLVQPFIDEIVDAGEWSFVFFDGTFSHALIKRTHPEDFRTQPQFGAVHTRTEPPAHLLERARAAMESLGERCLYARVDGVVVRERFHVMELELIEPCLYLDGDRAAAARFARAILARMR
ncbi:RimK family alpha-L-glutamate ligase [Pendulispora albinea]|uniref:Prokaryotic glutathione synthetase ATP-binding domain-containing protein n=1 Tax=Pendulispora albinea TaxID=2741071 RepID=A0ABZ2M2Y6_9BACT